MAELSPDIDRSATKIESTIFKALHSVGQCHVARAIGVSEGTISEAKGKEIPRVARMLAACGLKVVPADHECLSREYIRALRLFARMGMEASPESQPLEWE